MADYAPQLVKILRESGCEFVRHGKGDHDIWKAPNGLRFPVDHKILSRHTANGILKQAGLSKQF
jgi:predicted RNA binding protein YcfA (HicA-like mRNA interferase family)